MSAPVVILGDPENPPVIDLTYSPPRVDVNWEPTEVRIALGVGIPGWSEAVLKWSGTSYPARPAGLPDGLARYVGPSEPLDWLELDRWDDTSGGG